MYSAGFLTMEEATAAVREPLEFAHHTNIMLAQTPHFTEHVRRLLEREYGPDRLYTEGFRAYTTVNIDMQRTGIEAVRYGLRELTKRHSFYGPEKKIPFAERELFLARQYQEMADSPLEKGRETDALVMNVDRSRVVLEVAVGREKGRIEADGLGWSLKGSAYQPGLFPRGRDIGQGGIP